jgi:predicted small secreted protein
MELEEKIQRAIDKVMENLKTEIEPQHIIKDGDYIYFRGEKYQKVETPQSFYDKLWGILKTKLGDTSDCDMMTDRVMDLIRENIPEPYKGMGLPEYFIGYNQAIEQIIGRLFE